MNVNDDAVTLSILVEGASEINTATQEIVSFKVFNKEEQYIAVPMLAEAERKRTGLPEVIPFAFVDHCIVSVKFRNDETLEVIKSLIREMMVQELIS